MKNPSPAEIIRDFKQEPRVEGGFFRSVQWGCSSFTCVLQQKCCGGVYVSVAGSFLNISGVGLNNGCLAYIF